MNAAPATMTAPHERAAPHPPLFASGLWSAEVDDYRSVIARSAHELTRMLADAERESRFPVAAVARLGALGIFSDRWAGGGRGDLGRAVIMCEELGRAVLGGLGVGVTVHSEAVLSMLARFADNRRLHAYHANALAGRALGCVAASEDAGGSDLTGLTTAAVREPGGWHVRGTKAYVSLGAAADFALVVARCAGHRASVTAPLLVALVPRCGLTVEARLDPVGARSLETVRLSVDAHVPDDHVLGRPGAGMAVVTWGLTHERLASAAYGIGTARMALALATSHLHARHQFGVPLYQHQALRLRIADLAAQVAVSRLALYALALASPGQAAAFARQVAGLKVTVARLGERVASECMHVLGARGYLEDRSSLARMWRDMRLARLGGGTDEMMWELVAGGLQGDDDAYAALVQEPGQ